MGSRAPLETRSTVTDEATLLAAIRDGSEAAFNTLVAEHHAGLLRLARAWTHDDAIAEEVAQETWMALLDGVARFEGRSSIKTWLCGILINIARARTRKEQRSVPMSALGTEEEANTGPTVNPDRFLPPDHHWAGHWSAPPSAWPSPEAALLNAELRSLLESEISMLPEAQREVLVLRDVEGFSGEEVCNVLGLTDTHQRVLLHRARAKLRRSLETYHQRTGSP